LEAIFRDNPFDTSNGNGIAILVQFLGNHLQRHLGIKKSISYNLAYDLIGSAVVTLGTGFETFEAHSPSLRKLVKDLVIALSSISKLPCRFERAKTFALAFEKHCKLEGNFIIFPDGKGTFGTGQKCLSFMDFNHRLPPPLESGWARLNP
jgi:hypothetical protein